MNLFIFTNTYPYGDVAGEQTFLTGEVKILSQYFDRIILVPQKELLNLLPLQNGVEVDVSFAKNFTLVKRIFAFLRGLFSRSLYEDIWMHLPASLTFGYLKKLFFFISGARLTKQWIENLLMQGNISDTNVICYTYWFTEVTTGLGWAKNKFPKLRIVSRTHGYDLYEELYKPWPLRLQSISLIDGLYADSDIGTNYLREKYPQFSEKYNTALLGVPDAGGCSNPSEDGALRIVSCSTINTIKRLDLLFQGVVAAAQMRKDQKIEWTHFGGGSERHAFIDRIANEFPVNAKGFFPGYQTQHHLIQTYLNQQVDVFVNVSSTEGTPVSIMEAISCGIPVIATAVGGNVEIVNETNGYLLSPNPAPEEIAQMLLNVCDHREQLELKRHGSRTMWLERYNETKNFEKFAQTLIEIRKS